MERSTIARRPGHGEDASRPGDGGDASPSVDLRVVLFTITGDALQVALADADGKPALPRGVTVRGEPLDAAARRVVREATGVPEQYLEQLYTLSLDDPDGWTVIVAYLGLVCSAADADQSGPAAQRWRAVADVPTTGADRAVVDYALLRLRAKLGYTTIAFHLLPPTFTLSELQRAYETILGRPLDKRNFRRRVIAADILASTDAQRRDGNHRPAQLYRFRAAHDRDSYLTPPWANQA